VKTICGEREAKTKGEKRRREFPIYHGRGRRGRAPLLPFPSIFPRIGKGGGGKNFVYFALPRVRRGQEDPRGFGQIGTEDSNYKGAFQEKQARA